MKIKETKNDNIQITMTKEEAKEFYRVLKNQEASSNVEMDIWELFYDNEHLL